MKEPTLADRLEPVAFRLTVPAQGTDGWVLERFAVALRDSTLTFDLNALDNPRWKTDHPVELLSCSFEDLEEWLHYCRSWPVDAADDHSPPPASSVVPPLVVDFSARAGVSLAIDSSPSKQSSHRGCKRTAIESS